ncbi:Histidine transport system permease protein HisQ [compost metagenome]
MFLNGFAALIIEGAMTTIKLALLSMLLAVLLGLLGATAKLAKSRVLRHLATIYTTLIRAVPDLVLMLLLFYSIANAVEQPDRVDAGRAVRY